LQEFLVGLGFKVKVSIPYVKLLNYAIILKELKFISNENYLELRVDVESITNKINALGITL